MDIDRRIEKAFLELDHDSMLEICKYLKTFKDQLAFAKCCKDMCDMIVTHLWKKKSKRMIMRPFQRFTLDNVDELFYVRAMRKHFTTFNALVAEESILALSVHMNVCTFLRILKAENVHEFPAITTAQLYYYFPRDYYDNMKELCEMMPNLQELEVHIMPVFEESRPPRDFFEQGLFNRFNNPTVDVCDYSFANLKKLELHSKTRYRGFTFHLPTLESLLIDMVSIPDNIDAIIQLPKLKELNVRVDREDILMMGREAVHLIVKRLVGRKSDKIKNMAIKNEVMRFNHSWDNILLPHKLSKLNALFIDYWKFEEVFDSAYLKPCNFVVENISFGIWTSSSPSRLYNLIKMFPKLLHLRLNMLYEREIHLLELACEEMQRTERLVIIHKQVECDEIYEQWKGNQYVELVPREYDFNVFTEALKIVWED